MLWLERNDNPAAAEVGRVRVCAISAKWGTFSAHELALDKSHWGAKISRAHDGHFEPMSTCRSLSFQLRTLLRRTGAG